MKSDVQASLWSGLQQDLEKTAAGADGTRSALPSTPIQQRRRRGFDDASDSGLAALKLVDDDGVLRWVYEAPSVRRMSGRRAWRASNVAPKDVVQRYEFPELGNNQITSALEGVDLMLNPVRGLVRWESAPQGTYGAGAWVEATPQYVATLRGRVLLLVHGTFSKTAMYDSELLAVPKDGAQNSPTPGQSLWERWTDPRNGYSAILGFDHATLSMAPWLNALALAQSLSGIGAEIDAVCHSRGGLVASWALRVSNLKFRQIVFVGSPLMGTSLAAPNRLRSALDLLANVANAVSATSLGLAAAFPPASPLALGAAGLSRALGRSLQLGAALPLADAVVAMVPGLQSQSRVANNLELRALSLATTSVKLRGIGVTFKPDEVKQPVWAFWKRFSHLGAQAGYYVGDMIFQQPNDLVVDVDSMNQLGPMAGPENVAPRLTDWRDLGEKAQTHHCSYFRDAEAIGQLDEWLR